MRIVAWNVNHRTRRKPVPEALPATLLALGPDLVVLTEYVVGPDHDGFCKALRTGGLNARFMTSTRTGHNQVFVATRLSAQAGTFTHPDPASHAASNWLHIRIFDPALDLVGLRVPMYETSAEAHAYWTWFEEASHRFLSAPAVLIGDLNVDPDRPPGPGSEALQRLRTLGWQIPAEEGPWSWIGSSGVTSRLDHALLSPFVRCRSARYLDRVDGRVVAGPDALSDHALLVLDIELGGEQPDVEAE
ncbi:MAG: endonuclease/exonuclease/phosphatase family protein [Deltaproteobacteria bacterium]|nr:endonuclease/exonuclease/phosphatase family protein [Deltaproteobacteria bacterium]